jgi:hypothetical protein
MEEKLNFLDSGSGDGDCGSTLTTGARGTSETVYFYSKVLVLNTLYMKPHPDNKSRVKIFHETYQLIFFNYKFFTLFSFFFLL